MSRVALDSNIILYFAGVSRTKDDHEKISRIRALLARLSDKVSLIAPTQALGEVFVVMRRIGTPAEEARAAILEFAAQIGTAASEMRTLLAAMDLAVDHKLQFWDALILTAAVEAECTLLLSEDMHHGLVVRGLTVVNPLTSEIHPKLAACL